MLSFQLSSVIRFTCIILAGGSGFRKETLRLGPAPILNINLYFGLSPSLFLLLEKPVRAAMNEELS